MNDNLMRCIVAITRWLGAYNSIQKTDQNTEQPHSIYLNELGSQIGLVVESTQTVCSQRET